ncbi:hypothetical protein FDECE_2012 [Fusarium decemcellulare]|nr:hypothetical protein FDECE_2012 [Fusarium decemcellulare]
MQWPRDRYQGGKLKNTKGLFLLSRFLQSRYIRDLEERVASLEARLRERGIADEDVEAIQRSPSNHPETSEPFLAAVETSESRAANSPAFATINAPGSNATAGRILDLARPRHGQEDSFSKVLLTEIMTSKMTPQTATSMTTQSDSLVKDTPSDIVGGLYKGPISLPEREVAQNLIKTYFHFANLGMPLLHEPTFQSRVDFLYTIETRVINLEKTHITSESRIAVFFVLEVFAIALLSLQEAARIPTWVTDRYHKMAITALNAAGLPNNIEGVQALVLIGQYSYHHPIAWATWKTMGAALRLAVELGLHQDPAKQLDPLTLDTRRRTFWVAYMMDRNISVALAMPIFLSDGAIGTEFPTDVEDKYITADGTLLLDARVSASKEITLHLLRYRQIQSQIRTVLGEKSSPYFNDVAIDETQWQQQMRQRIDSWYRGGPAIEDLASLEKDVVETFKVTYNTALFHLYRPSIRIPHPSGEQLVEMAHAATNMIQLYRRLFCERKLTIYWQAVENVSSAGTAIMYAYVQSPEVRSYVDFRSLESLVHTCSSVLWGMVEHFPAYRGKRDAFDMTANEVLVELGAGTGTISSHADGTTILDLTSPVTAENMASERTVSRSDQVSSAQSPSLSSQAPSIINLESPREGHRTEFSTLGSTDDGVDMWPQLTPLSLEDFDNLFSGWDVTSDANAPSNMMWM